MKSIVVIAVLLVVGLCLALDVQETVQRKHQFIRKRLHEYEQTQTRMRFSSATGAAHLVTETPKSLAKRSTYETDLDGLAAFLSAHPQIGIKDYKTELVEVSRRQDAQIKTLTMITYQQVYKGVAVANSLLKAMVNTQNQVVSISGNIVPDLDVDVVPELTESEAVTLSRTALPTDMTFDLAESKLIVYRTEMPNGLFGTNHLAYHVIFKCTQHLESHFVYIDAHSGTVLDSFSPDPHALNRTAVIFGVGTVFTEGNSLPEEAQSRLAIEVNGAEYKVMKNVGGYDGWDLNGGEFKNTVNVPTNGIDGFICPNAVFYGAPIGAVYCPGFAAIDVIAHEFGHGYVKGIVGDDNGLVYQGQSGALNEAFADVFGETIQLLLKSPQDYPIRSDRSCVNSPDNARWIVGDSLAKEQQNFPNVNGSKIGLRDMYNPNCFNDPVSTSDPKFMCGNADNGGVHTNSGVMNQVYALFVDGGFFNGTTFTGVGLTKAFHIFMRGLAKHVPTSTFAQNADFNVAACNELANGNVNLVDLMTGNPTGQIVVSDDCTTLSNLYTAVQMTGEICPATTTPVPDPVPIVIRGPFPPLVLNVGMDVVYWQTANWGDRFVLCNLVGGYQFFGDKFKTQYAEYIYCPIPVIQGTGTVQITFRPSGGDFLNFYTLTVIDPFSLNAYGPEYGPIEGGTTVRIEGSGFIASTTGCNPTAADDGFDCVACYFGYDANGQPVPAIVDSATTASCVTPNWNALDTNKNKSVEIWLTMNYFLAIGPLDFEYKDGIGPVGATPLIAAPFAFSQAPANNVTVISPVATPGSTPQKKVSSANTEVASIVLAVSGLLMALL